MKITSLIFAVILVMTGCSGINNYKGSGDRPQVYQWNLEQANQTSSEQQVIQEVLAKKPGGNIPFPKKPGSEKIQISVGGPYPGQTWPFEATSIVKKTDQNKYEVTFILSWKLQDVPHDEEDEGRPNVTLSHQWAYEVDGNQVDFKGESGDRIPSIR